MCKEGCGIDSWYVLVVV